jgi:hypothetical protein
MALTGKSQDQIILLNNEVIDAKVMEVKPSVISYKRSDNPTGPVFVLSVSEIKKIRYANGQEENFGAPVQTSTVIERTVTTQTAVPTDTRVKYSGPRVGCTLIGPGKAADYIEDMGKNPFVSQFGWQFETRIFTSSSGISGLVEFVPLVGGLEQGMFLPSGSLLFGLRGAGGFEFAIGPNLSLTGLGLVMAVGTSVKVDDIYFPINLAIVPSVSNATSRYDYASQSQVRYVEKTGIRISLLVGFNTKKR